MARSGRKGPCDRVLKYVAGNLTLVCSLGTAGPRAPVRYYGHDYGNANWILGKRKVLTWKGQSMRYGDTVGYSDSLYLEKSGEPEERRDFCRVLHRQPRRICGCQEEAVRQCLPSD